MVTLQGEASDPANQNRLPYSNVTITNPLITDSSNLILRLEMGDPKLLVPYWKMMSDKCSVVIEGWKFMSHESDASNVCQYMLPELGDAIKRIHSLVHNAAIQDKHIIVGTGSTQLFHAAWFALSSSDSVRPINIVSAAPFYSLYLDGVKALRSGLYQWAGDAATYDKDEPYIEMVTSQNNPVVRSASQGKLIHDLAYYWPQYTPITHHADHDLMLFTFSKCTGHAGSRIGWAIVKDIQVAKKMVHFIQVSTTGVSKESQIRAAKILGVVCDSYQSLGPKGSEHFFDYGKRLLRERWDRMRQVIGQCEVFTVAKPSSAYCNFTKESFETNSAFAWVKCEGGIEDCGTYLKNLGILARPGRLFGVGPEFARISMLSTNDEFDELLTRLLNARREYN
ncbi:tryptophan aminotransferase-related protein 1-like [Arachis duranensis]|uniref:Tryptophan aminotransferase-related protein 1-like n=1 Tax=Arachis duranensis TaxID=130453 RepID=A0A6P4CUC7_ARADU|nr:tryptophan aminotransferase-related protein 1-like [Arachis duranensis]